MGIVEERGKSYGKGDDNLTRIAGMWTAYLGHPVTAHDVSLMMVLLKCSRAKQDPQRPDNDNYLDGRGYLELAERLR